jgi:hypothetical protein
LPRSPLEHKTPDADTRAREIDSPAEGRDVLWAFSLEQRANAERSTPNAQRQTPFGRTLDVERWTLEVF